MNPTNQLYKIILCYSIYFMKKYNPKTIKMNNGNVICISRKEKFAKESNSNSLLVLQSMRIKPSRYQWHQVYEPFFKNAGPIHFLFGS